MFFCPQSQLGGKLSTNIVVIVHASYAERKSRRIKRLVTPAKNLSVFSGTKFKAQELPGQSGGGSGRKIDASMDGAETIGSAKRDSETI